MAVYFVQAGDDGPIKIGFASDVARRLPGLQVNSPDRLHILNAIEGDRALERALHRRFAADRVRGEWFSPSVELLGFVQRLPALPTASTVAPRPCGRRWRVAEIISSAGGVVQLGKIAGVDHSTVSAWKKSDRVPHPRARSISEALSIPLSEIRPDVWRPDPASPHSETGRAA